MNIKYSKINGDDNSLFFDNIYLIFLEFLLSIFVELIWIFLLLFYLKLQMLFLKFFEFNFII